MSLHLKELPNEDLLVVLKRPRGVLLEEGIELLAGPIKNDMNPIVSCFPGVLDKQTRPVLVNPSQGVPEPVECLAQGGTPPLTPMGVGARIASAVVFPPLDTVDTAPRGVLDDLDLVARWVLFQILAVVGETGEAIGLNVVECVGEGHVTEPMVVTVGFTICGDMDDLRPFRCLGKRGEKPFGKGFSTLEESFKGNRPRNRTVIEEDGHGPARTEGEGIRPCRIDFGATHVVPFARSQTPHPLCLMGRQNGETNTGLGHHGQCLEIDSRLG